MGLALAGGLGNALRPGEGAELVLVRGGERDMSEKRTQMRDD